jgi:ATP-dependent Lon protease
LEKKLKRINVTVNSLNRFLGVRKYDFISVQNINRIGQVTGLAWTEIGGDLLTIETVTMEGKGKLKITGQIGDVMQESVYAAMTVVRKMSIFYNIEYRVRADLIKNSYLINLTSILNDIKIGIIYGLIVDAFKLGS